jgi:hypothetical protein
MLLSLQHIANWVEAHQLVCPVKKYVHIDCPGCGLQRSFVALLKGDILLSIHYHPVTVPLLLFFLYGMLHAIFKFKHGNKIVLYVYLFVAAILVSNYIYRIVLHNLT